MNPIDVYVLVDEAMTVKARKAFLDRFTEINPRWRGAHVADVIATLEDSDAHLGVTDACYEYLSERLPSKWHRLIGPCALAVHYTEPEVVNFNAAVTSLIIACDMKVKGGMQE